MSAIKRWWKDWRLRRGYAALARFQASDPEEIAWRKAVMAYQSEAMADLYCSATIVLGGRTSHCDAHRGHEGSHTSFDGVTWTRGSNLDPAAPSTGRESIPPTRLAESSNDKEKK